MLSVSVSVHPAPDGGHLPSHLSDGRSSAGAQVSVLFVQHTFVVTVYDVGMDGIGRAPH